MSTLCSEEYTIVQKFFTEYFLSWKKNNSVSHHQWQLRFDKNITWFIYTKYVYLV